MFINHRQHEDLRQLQTRRIPEPPCIPTQTIKMALNPTRSATFNVLAYDYGAVDFQDALADFLACLNNPGVSASSVHLRAEDTLIPFRSVPVFHNIKFTKPSHSGEPEILDTVHVRPEVASSPTRIVPVHFDTVIVRQDSLQGQGNKGKSRSYQNRTPD